ncbi:MAG: tol-pal system protein YbgF, partial [Alphaproteobacteria bacterium]
RRIGSRQIVCAAMLAVALTGLAPPARGQNDLGPVIDRLDRLERQLTTLERGVYRDGAGTRLRPPPGAAPAPVARLPANLAASMEVRLGEIETQLRELTGKFEEVGHRMGRLDGRLDKLVADVDVRMRALEDRLAAGGAPETASTSRAGEGEASQTAAASPLPEGTPEEQYRYAVSRLVGADRDADYAEAERALAAFIDAHPGHELESNVRYWLGESHYVRRDYNRAAVVFAEAYKAVPKGRKAQDSLLKLGMSLGQIGKSADACNTFAELVSRFPLARPEIVTALARERKRYGCR